MYITLETDYGVRIMLLLAQQENKLHAQAIADGAGIPKRFTLKILKKLKDGGLLNSYIGKNGGYVLSRSAENITLCEIIEILEGEYMFSRCLQDGHECSYETAEIKENCVNANCNTRDIFSDITKTVRNKLMNTTLKQLI